MHYFDKPSQFLKVDPETIKEQTLYRAKQAFDWNGDQNPSTSFAVYWFSLVRESYRQAHKVHPISSVKRKQYLNSVYPYGSSVYRNASRFLRWYLQRTGGLLIGDPSGNYFTPINTADIDLKYIPNPQPNALADTYTLALLQYYLKPPTTRITRKQTGYGFIKLTAPRYVLLPENDKQERLKWDRNNQTQISGYLNDELIREIIRNEIGIYIRHFENVMDDRYVRFLRKKLGLN